MITPSDHIHWLHPLTTHTLVPSVMASGYDQCVGTVGVVTGSSGCDRYVGQVDVVSGCMAAITYSPRSVIYRIGYRMIDLFVSGGPPVNALHTNIGVASITTGSVHYIYYILQYYYILLLALCYICRGVGRNSLGDFHQRINTRIARAQGRSTGMARGKFGFQAF